MGRTITVFVIIPIKENYFTKWKGSAFKNEFTNVIDGIRYY